MFIEDSVGDTAQPGFLSICRKRELLPKRLNRILYSGAAADSDAYKSFCELFPGADLVSTDIAPGTNVQLIWDQEKPPEDAQRQQFDLFITTSVLEHVRRPWLAAPNIEMCLRRPHGLLYISVPWVWRYHEYPDDYWRFSPPSLDILFHNTKPLLTMWSTSPDCQLHEWDNHLDNKLSLTISGKQISKAGRKYLPYLLLHQLRVVAS